MKLSTAFGLALAPVSMARQANVETELSERGITVIGGTNAATGAVILWVNPGNGAPTTTMNQQVAAKGAANHTVKVGGAGLLSFEPPQVNAAVGDTVIFEFLTRNHSVTQSPFNTPCKALPGGMDTDFQPNPNNDTLNPPRVGIQVNATNPQWFYCKQQGHCGKGMVFSINPTTDKTQAMFQQAAIRQNGNGQTTPITGGGANAPSNGTAGSVSSSAGVAPTGNVGGGGASTPNNGTASSVSSSAGVAPTGNVGGGSGGVVAPGQGTVGADGSCSCVAACDTGSFPAKNQGTDSFGGMGGTLPIGMAAVR
ncbi:Uncharacterized protein TPAR_06879 [Tolypocladium paradoxum]|uniref:Uncharacterized protein n=1 Tax=Tolypocladium paradoxum TaxID=94208 RepID=A0A2S4KS14_9HYPO|nr:Uncharacterized protein TPAR_06879 [Tolypocladium paradoxum]